MVSSRSASASQAPSAAPSSSGNRVASSGSAASSASHCGGQQLAGRVVRPLVGGEVEQPLEDGVHERPPRGGRARRLRQPVDDAEPVEQRALHEVGGAARGQGRGDRDPARRRFERDGCHASNCRREVRQTPLGLPGGHATRWDQAGHLRGCAGHPVADVVPGRRVRDLHLRAVRSRLPARAEPAARTTSSPRRTRCCCWSPCSSTSWPMRCWRGRTRCRSPASWPTSGAGTPSSRPRPAGRCPARSSRSVARRPTWCSPWSGWPCGTATAAACWPCSATRSTTPTCCSRCSTCCPACRSTAAGWWSRCSGG